MGKTVFLFITNKKTNIDSTFFLEKFQNNFTRKKYWESQFEINTHRIPLLLIEYDDDRMKNKIISVIHSMKWEFHKLTLTNSKINCN